VNGILACNPSVFCLGQKRTPAMQATFISAHDKFDVRTGPYKQQQQESILRPCLHEGRVTLARGETKDMALGLALWTPYIHVGPHSQNHNM
jgi:hypothetical protein